MKTLAKYHGSNHCVISEKTFKNILIGPDNLPGLSRNGPQVTNHTTVKWPIVKFVINYHPSIIKLSIRASGQRQSRPVWIET